MVYILVEFYSQIPLLVDFRTGGAPSGRWNLRRFPWQRGNFFFFLRNQLASALKSRNFREFLGKRRGADAPKPNFPRARHAKTTVFGKCTAQYPSFLLWAVCFPQAASAPQIYCMKNSCLCHSCHTPVSYFTICQTNETVSFQPTPETYRPHFFFPRVGGTKQEINLF